MPLLDLSESMRSPRVVCLIIIVAIYLISQCAVNWGTVRDNCNEDSQLASFFNFVNFCFAILLVVYACYTILKMEPS